MNRFNKIYWGMALGLLLPVLFGFLFITVLGGKSELPQSEIFKNVIANGDFSFKLFIVSITPNLFCLFIFYKMELWRICSGIISTTLIYFIIAITQL